MDAQGEVLEVTQELLHPRSADRRSGRRCRVHGLHAIALLEVRTLVQESPDTRKDARDGFVDGGIIQLWVVIAGMQKPHTFCPLKQECLLNVQFRVQELIVAS